MMIEKLAENEVVCYSKLKVEKVYFVAENEWKWSFLYNTNEGTRQKVGERKDTSM